MMWWGPLHGVAVTHICAYTWRMGVGEGGSAIRGLLESALAYREPAGAVPGEIGDEMIALRRVIDVLEVKFAGLAWAYSSSDQYLEDGFASPTDWIRVNCRMSASLVSDRVCVGRMASAMPNSVTALEEGKIGFGHLGAMAWTGKALSESPTGAGFSEVPLLERAVDLTVGRFRELCHHARHAADPKGAALEQELAVEDREFEMSAAADGMYYLRGRLDSAGGAVLRTALEPLARKSGAEDHRVRGRRMADALVEMAGHCLDQGTVPNTASQRTHLQVTTTLETLMGMAGAPAGDLEYSLPISARTVERLACDCSVTRVLLGSDSMVVDVGRARRVISGPMRKAMNIRDHGCVWPGCERPASWTSGHHLQHWIRGGPTDLSNLYSVCNFHHYLLHEGGWQITPTESGFITIPPAGTMGPSFLRGPTVLVDS